VAALRDTLVGMIKRARIEPDPVRTRLAKGLTIAIKFEGDALAVQLSRADVFPSVREWKTVIDMMPQHTIFELPKSFISKNVYYLQGKIKLSKELL